MVHLLFLVWIGQHDLKLGSINPKVNCNTDETKSYALYLPSTYDANQPWPILLLFEPASRAKLPLEQFQEAAESLGFILACSNDTANYLSWEENWKSVEAMWNDIAKKFAVDGKRIYVGGFSGGARLASNVAFTTKMVAGLVACGAGLAVPVDQAPPISFDVISTVGTQDFNYRELLDLEHDLTEIRVQNEHLMFDGGHDWPPLQVAFDVLAWLEIRAVQKGLTEIKATKLDMLWQHTNQRIREIDETNLIRISNALDFAIETYSDLIGTDQLQNQLKEIKESKAFKEQEKDHQNALKWEKNQKASIFNHLMLASQFNAKQPRSMRKELTWWPGYLKNLSKVADKHDESHQGDAANRLINLLFSNLYESSIFLAQKEEWDKLIYLNKVWSAMQPERAFPYLNQAHGYTMLDEQNRAIEAIKTAIEKGVQRERLLKDPRFKDLKSHPDWQKLF